MCGLFVGKSTKWMGDFPNSHVWLPKCFYMFVVLWMFQTWCIKHLDVSSACLCLKRGMWSKMFFRFQIVWQLLSRPNRFVYGARQCSSSTNGRQLWLMPSFHRFPLVTLDLWKHSETCGNIRKHSETQLLWLLFLVVGFLLVSEWFPHHHHLSGTPTPIWEPIYGWGYAIWPW